MSEIEERSAFEELDTIEVSEETKVVLADQEGEQEQEAEQQVERKEEGRKERKRRKRADFQKRLNELTREKHEEREARAAAEAKAELLEQRLQEMEKSGRESSEAILKQREQELTEKRRKAEEDGDLSAYSAASDELFAVRGQLRQRPSQPERRTEPSPRQQEPQMVPEAAAWLEANPWFVSEENEHLRSEVVRIQDDLVRRGHDLKNPEHAKKVYAEIDRIIRERPEFDSVIGVEQEEHEEQAEPEKKPAPRSHIAPPSRGGEAPVRQKPGQLSNYDIAAIKRAGLDPNNPKVRETYIKYNRKQA